METTILFRELANEEKDMTRQRGFTLIELLIVMAIIGIMAGFSLSAMQGALAKARDTQRKNDLRQIQIALEAFKADHGHYPTNPWAKSASGGNWIVDTSTNLPLDQAYLKNPVLDPVNTGGGYGFENWSGYTYSYYSGGWCFPAGTNYILIAHLEGDNGVHPQQYTRTGECGGWWPTSPTDTNAAYRGEYGLQAIAP